MTSNNPQQTIDELKGKHYQLKVIYERKNLNSEQKQRVLGLMETVADKLHELIQTTPDEEARLIVVETSKKKLERIESKSNIAMLNVEKNLGMIDELINQLEETKNETEN